MRVASTIWPPKRSVTALTAGSAAMAAFSAVLRLPKDRAAGRFGCWGCARSGAGDGRFQRLNLRLRRWRG